MDAKKIADAKAEIRAGYEEKIRKLREEMEAALDSLSKAEKTLTGITFVSHSSMQRKEQASKSVENRISAGTRMKRALAGMDRDFLRPELFNRTRHDGIDIEIANGTLAVEFAHLVKNKEIIVLQKPHGSKCGLYRRAGNESSVESAPTSQEELL